MRISIHMERKFEHPAYEDYKTENGNDAESHEDAGVTNNEDAILRAIKHATDTNDSKLLDGCRERYEALLSTKIQEAIQQKDYKKVQEIANILSLMQKGDYSFIEESSNKISDTQLEETEFIFPEILEQQSNDFLEFKKLAKDFPNIREAEYDTVEKELQKGGNEKDKIVDSINYIESKIGQIYELKKLTKKELFLLEEKLKKFGQENNLGKIRHFIDYFGDISKYSHNPSEQRQIKKIISACEENRDLNIQANTLNKLIEGRYPLINKAPEYSRYKRFDRNEKKNAEITPNRAFAELFFLEEIVAKREPQEILNCFENIKTAIDYYKNFLEKYRTNPKFPDLRSEIDQLKNLSEFYASKNRLTATQQDYAYDLIKTIKRKLDLITK